MDNSTIYITIGIGALLGLVGILFISKYSSSFQLWRRALALLTGFTGLVFLIIEPQYSELQVPVKAHLGQNLSKQDSFSFYFNDVHSLISDPIYNLIDTIQIHGGAISPEDLQLIHDIPVSWQRQDSMWGITDIVPNRYYVNEENELAGLFHGNITSIVLQVPDGQFYPATISDSNFHISWTPKLSGFHNYNILAIASSGDTIVEQLPLRILPEAKWNLLALLAYPSAEFKQMKNYWTQLGHGVASRTLISRDRYASSFTNLRQYDLSTINRRLLNQFDLVILQGRQWNQLNEASRNRILYQVSNNGLGLLILQQDVSQKFYLLNNPDTRAKEIKKINSTSLHTPLQALELNSKSGWRKITYDNHVISRVKNYGLGKIQILGLSDTYKLKLEGRQKEYQQIWSQVFSAIFTDFNTDNTLIKPSWIHAGETQELQLLLDEVNEELEITHNGEASEFIRTPNIKGHLTLHVRPKPGRNTIRISNSGEEFSYFAHPEGTWTAKRAKLFSSLIEQYQQLPKRKLKAQFENKPYSPFWWFALCLAGFGLLWLDERVS